MARITLASHINRESRGTKSKYLFPTCVGQQMFFLHHNFQQINGMENND
jgi:hypothetical protein